MQAYRRNSEGVTNGGSILVFLPFVIIGLVVSVIIFLVIAGVYTLTPMQPSALSSLAVAVSMVCVFGVSLLAGRSGVAPGWVAGGITGLGYALVLVIVGWISRVVSPISIQPLIILFACAFIGTVGGIFGINLRPRRRSRW